jgi:hypothetical protein
MWEGLDVGSLDVGSLNVGSLNVEGTGPGKSLRSRCLAPITCATRTRMLVGMARFESMRRTVTTPASRRQCSTRLSYTPTRRYLIKFLDLIREGNLRFPRIESMRRTVTTPAY